MQKQEFFPFLDWRVLSWWIKQYHKSYLQGGSGRRASSSACVAIRLWPILPPMSLLIRPLLFSSTAQWSNGLEPCYLLKVWFGVSSLVYPRLNQRLIFARFPGDFSAHSCWEAPASSPVLGLSTRGWKWSVDSERFIGGKGDASPAVASKDSTRIDLPFVFNNPKEDSSNLTGQFVL